MEKRTLTFKPSAKGCLSAYGLGAFPVSLYKDQWEAILDHAPQIVEALKKFDKQLKTKEDS